MKNLLIYINPKGFDDEHNILVKIQIDNSLGLGWKKEDILLVTNFDYEYNGIKAIVISSDVFCTIQDKASKINAIIYLIEHGIIKKEELYWFHDFDVYQLDAISESELELGAFDLSLTTYGWSGRWNIGSMFFKESSKDIFNWIRDTIYKYKIDGERSLKILTKSNFNNINDRIKYLNITYNFGMRKIPSNYQQAIKPLKAIHFHPFRKYGKDKIYLSLMNERLIKIFNNHGIT